MSSIAVGESIGGHGPHKFEIYVTDWAPELTTSEAISPPRLPVTTDGPTAEMRPKLEVTETRLRERKARSLAKAKLACEASLLFRDSLKATTIARQGNLSVAILVELACLVSNKSEHSD